MSDSDTTDGQTDLGDNVTEVDGIKTKKSSADANEELPIEDAEDRESSDDETEPDSFPRQYVEELREEAKSWRVKAQRAEELEKTVDDLAHRLHTELVRATGRLADPTDMPFDEAHLSSPEALTAAIDGLLTHKPHLGSRKPIGSVGQGAVTVPAQNVDLAGILRGKAQ